MNLSAGRVLWTIAAVVVLACATLLITRDILSRAQSGDQQ